MDSSSRDLRVDRATLSESEPAALAWAVFAPGLRRRELLRWSGASYGVDAPAHARAACAPRASLLRSRGLERGFDQSFLNSTGLLAPDAVERFHRMGCPRPQISSPVRARSSPTAPRLRTWTTGVR